MPNPSREQILATTFNRLHPQKVEGGSVPEEFRVEYVSDRTETVATALMGLTWGCCRCHAHKYDPIAHDEYYELSAFFANIDEAGLYSYFTNSVPTPTLPLPTDEQTLALEQCRVNVERAERAYREAIEHQSAELRRQPNFAAELPPTLAEPILALEFEEPPESANVLTPGIDGQAIQLTGDDPVETEVGEFARWQPFSVSLWIRPPVTMERAVILHQSRAATDSGSRGIQLLIEDGYLTWSLIHFWPGNAISIRTDQPLPVNEWVHVVATYDGSTRAAGLKLYLDGEQAIHTVTRDALTKTILGSSDGKGKFITIGERFRDRGFTRGVVGSTPSI